jgi:hypothetical protein
LRPVRPSARTLVQGILRLRRGDANQPKRLSRRMTRRSKRRCFTQNCIG